MKTFTSILSNVAFKALSSTAVIAGPKTVHSAVVKTNQAIDTAAVKARELANAAKSRYHAYGELARPTVTFQAPSTSRALIINK